MDAKVTGVGRVPGRWAGCWWMLAAWGLLLSGLGGLASDRGRPLVRSWRPLEYRGSPQVGAVAIGPDGVVHFGSGNLLITYDGVEFTRLETPLNHIRALAIDGAGAIFLGGTDDFGVVRRDVRGRLAYESMAVGLGDGSRQFGVIWEVGLSGRDVWFSAEKHVFQWREGRLRSWAYTNGPGTSGVLVSGTNVFVQTTGVGLREFDGTDLVVRSTNALVARGLVMGMAPRAGGGWWVLSRNFGLVRWEGETMEPAVFPGSDVLAAARPSSMTVMADGRLLVATGRGGLFLVDPQRGIDRRWTAADGLLADAIRDVAMDGSRTWWLATDVGLQAVDLPLAVTVFDEADGLPPGLCGGLLRQDGRLVISILEGIYELQPGVGAERARWQVHPHSIHYPQDIVADGSGLLVAGEQGLYRLTRDSGEPVYKVTGGLMTVATVPGRTNELVAGLRDGLVSLARDGSGWKEVRRFEGLGEVRNILTDAAGQIWLATTARGAHRIQLGSGAGELAWKDAEVRSFNRSNGGLGEPQDYVQGWWVPDGLRIVGTEHLWKPGPRGTNLVVDDRILGRRGPLGWMASTAPAEEGAFWANAAYQSIQDEVDYPLVRFVRGEDGAWRPQGNSTVLADALGFVGSIRTFREEGAAGEVVWAKGMERLVRVEPARFDWETGPWTVHVREFLALGTNQPVRSEDGPAATRSGRLAHSRHPYVFRFAAGRADRGAGVQYQWRLSGWSEDWTAWSARREASWSGLPGGTYTFEVRGRDRAGLESGITRWRFEVAPPWYLSLWAWLGYVGTGGLLFHGAVRFRVRQAEGRARMLELQVTERTRELAEARDVAEEANRAKSRFLANMSHELRTPLNGILGFAQILSREQGMDPRNRERLRIIRSSGDHLLGLINDVLDLSRVEAGRMELRVAPFRPADLFRDLEASFAPRAVERGVELRVVWEGSAGEARQGDAQRLRQVLENLVGNALKFTPRGRVVLSGRVLGMGERVQFEVQDTGAGMTSDDVERLFQPFSQAVSGRPPEPGAGLGLAISQHLVGLMGGRIAVESSVGVGSRFAFEVVLPLAAGAGAAVAPEEGRPITGYAGARKRVLVVDDVEINRRLLRELFEPLGFLVEEAGSGGAALANPSRVGGVDLVLMDLRMPGMDGLELTRRLRALGGFKGRIVAMSASVLGFGRADALAAGADDFVGKPFQEEVLLQVVGTVLGIEWVRSADAGARAASGTLLAGGVPERPEEAILRPLRDAAARGDILEFRNALGRAWAAHPGHEAYFRQLELLAAGYRMAALREMLADERKDG